MSICSSLVWKNLDAQPESYSDTNLKKCIFIKHNIVFYATRYVKAEILVFELNFVYLLNNSLITLINETNS